MKYAFLLVLGGMTVLGAGCLGTTPTDQPVLPPDAEVGTGNTCLVSGCSGEICSDAANGPMMSDCMYRPEYACYDPTTCRPQADGKCGWTQTAALAACLQNPPALE